MAPGPPQKSRTAAAPPIATASVSERESAAAGAKSLAEAEAIWRSVPVQSVIDAMSAHVAVLDADGIIVAVNSAWRRFALQEGWDSQDFGVGRSYLAICEAASDAEPSAREAAALIKAVLGGEKGEATLEYPCDSPAQARWFRMDLAAIPGVTGALITHSNVTPEHQAQARAEVVQSSLREMTDNLGEVMFLVDVQSMRCLYVSQAFERMWQRSRSEVLDDLWAWYDTVHPEDRETARAAFGQGLTHGAFLVTYRILLHDGAQRWIETQGWPVHDAHGRFVRLTGISKDVTDRHRAAQALQQSQQRLVGIVESAMDAIITIDEAQHIVLLNPAAEAMFGYRADELLDLPLNVLLPVGSREAHAALVARFGHGARDPTAPTVRHRRMSAERQVEGLRKSGERFPVEVSISMDQSTGRPLYTAILRDQTERKAAEQRIVYLNRVHALLSGVNLLILRERDRMRLLGEACRVAVEAGGFAMALVGMVNAERRVQIVGSAGAPDGFCDQVNGTLGTPEADDCLAAQAIREHRILVSNDARRDPRVRYAAVARGAASVGVFPLRIGADTVGALVLYAAEPAFFHDEEVRLLSQLADDVAFGLDHIAKEQRIHQLAYFDAVTGLPNRTLFLERAAQHLGVDRRGEHRHAVLVFNVDRFRTLNDAFGRETGDALLRLVAQWLTSRGFDGLLAARVGSDQFAVLIPWFDQRSDEVLARRLRGLQERPFQVGTAMLRLSARAGVALYPDHGQDAESLLRNAETAVKEARSRGEHLVIYSSRMHEAMTELVTLESALRQALELNQFVLHYQPKRDLATRTLTGAEALIRWNDPARGLVPPAKFIPLLEQTGLIREVGRWALHQAMADHRDWISRGLVAPKIAVNVSAVQLRDRSFLGQLQALAVECTGVLGSALELEITESLMVDDMTNTIAILEAVRALGVGISMDDFGTGFSSLSYLSKLPIDTLKIDRAFVNQMTTGRQGLSLVSTMLTLARSLRLRVVAEGVETEEQERLLHLLGCDDMQGYLMSPALPASQFIERFLRGAS